MFDGKALSLLFAGLVSRWTRDSVSPATAQPQRPADLDSPFNSMTRTDVR